MFSSAVTIGRKVGSSNQHSARGGHCPRPRAAPSRGCYASGSRTAFSSENVRRIRRGSCRENAEFRTSRKSLLSRHGRLPDWDSKTEKLEQQQWRSAPWCQCFNYPASADGPALARRQQAGQLTAQCRQVRDLAVNLIEMMLRQHINLCAVARFIARELKECANLIERKPEVPRAANEAQPSQCRLAIGTIIARRAVGRRDQSLLLIPADRLDLGVGEARQITDTQIIHCLTL